MRKEFTVEGGHQGLQTLVQEIAALSKANLPSTEFFSQFLDKITEASDARGGAVWLVSSRGENEQIQFQLCAAKHLESSLFRTNEVQRKNIVRALSNVVVNERPLILFPSSKDESHAESNVITNLTVHPFIHIPLMLKKHAVGVLQIWLMPEVNPKLFGEYIGFLTSLASNVEQHLQSRRLEDLVSEGQRLQQLLQFSQDLSGVLEPVAVARLAATYARDIIGCERCSILTVAKDKWEALAISGQDTVEKRSSVVKETVAFVAAHTIEKTKLFSKADFGPKALTEGTEAPLVPLLEDSVATALEIVPVENGMEYFSGTEMEAAAIVPLLDPDGLIIGALFCESVNEHFFGDSRRPQAAPKPAVKAGEWIGRHSSRALSAANDYHTLPMLGTMRQMRDVKVALTSKRRNRIFTKTVIIGLIALVVLMFPKMLKVEGNCMLQPIERGVVVTEIPGRIESIIAHEGDVVKKGQVLAKLDTQRLQSDLDAATQERLRYEAEMERYRGAGDEASAQIASLQAQISGQREMRLKKEIELSSLRAPMDGVVLTKDLQLRIGEYLQSGAPFAEVAALEAWELQVQVAESDIGLIETALEEKRKPAVNFIMYAQSAVKLMGYITDQRQISTMATIPTGASQAMFFISVRDAKLPPEVLPQLRPGLTGRAKIEIRRQPLIVVLTHKFVNWLRMRWVI